MTIVPLGRDHPLYTSSSVNMCGIANGTRTTHRVHSLRTTERYGRAALRYIISDSFPDFSSGEHTSDTFYALSPWLYFLYCSHSSLVGMSSRFPINGSPREKKGGKDS